MNIQCKVYTNLCEEPFFGSFVRFEGPSVVICTDKLNVRLPYTRIEATDGVEVQ
jgi:hypothetical protein